MRLRGIVFEPRAMRVVHVPMLRDNYAYLLIDEASGEAAIVDPAEADRAEAAVAAAGVRLTTILNTHHHFDHTGGNLELLASHPELTVVGSAGDAAQIPGITRRVRDGDRVAVGGLEGRVLEVPCHTSGHVAYHFEDALFSGDTLFAAGCGRFFEGTAAQMYRALSQVIGALPDETLIYCGHEYTESNLAFAATLEPSNAAISEKRAEARRLRGEGRPTVPTRLKEERAYNPFLRTHATELLAAVLRADPSVDTKDPVAVLGAVRALKDRF